MDSYRAFENALRRTGRPSGLLAVLALVLVVGGLTAMAEVTMQRARIIESVAVPGRSAHDRVVFVEIDGRIRRFRVSDWRIPTGKGAWLCLRRTEYHPFGYRRHRPELPQLCPSPYGRADDRPGIRAE